MLDNEFDDILYSEDSDELLESLKEAHSNLLNEWPQSEVDKHLSTVKIPNPAYVINELKLYLQVKTIANYTDKAMFGIKLQNPKGDDITLAFTLYNNGYVYFEDGDFSFEYTGIPNLIFTVYLLVSKIIVSQFGKDLNTRQTMMNIKKLNKFNLKIR